MRLRPLHLCAWALALSGCAEKPPRRPPDVVVIVVDTLRSDHLSAYGYSRPTTPRLDRLASEGVLFEDVTSQAPWTLPSVVSLITGRYQTLSRDFIGDVGPTLAEAFQASGYATLGVVANPSLTRKAGFARGFDLYVKDDRQARGTEKGRRPNAPVQIEAASQSYFIADISDLDAMRAQLFGALDHSTRFAGENRPPMFLYLQPFDPHAPYYAHPDLNDPHAVLDDPHADRGDELPADAALGTELGAWQLEKLRESGPTPPPRDPDWKHALAKIAEERQRYDQEVRYADLVVGRILDGLEQRGFLENTIVAVLSDHGEGLWERPSGRPTDSVQDPDQFFYQAHGAQMYREALSTPFLLWGAGVPAGQRIDVAVQNLDLYPTLLELADVPARGELHGRSLVGLLRGDRAPLHEFVFANAVHKVNIREVATGLELTRLHPNPRARHHEPELFDLAADPLERHNLFSERPDEVERLDAQLNAWHETYYDDVDPLGESDPEQAAILRQLGYTGEDIGERD